MASRRVHLEDLTPGELRCEFDEQDRPVQVSLKIGGKKAGGLSVNYATRKGTFGRDERWENGESLAEEDNYFSGPDTRHTTIPLERWVEEKIGQLRFAALQKAEEQAATEAVKGSAPLATRMFRSAFLCELERWGWDLAAAERDSSGRCDGEHSWKRLAALFGQMRQSQEPDWVDAMIHETLSERVNHWFVLYPAGARARQQFLRIANVMMEQEPHPALTAALDALIQEHGVLDPDARELSAWHAMRSGNLDRAGELLVDVVKKKESTAALNNLAALQIDRGEHEAARATMARVAKIIEARGPPILSTQPREQVLGVTVMPSAEEVSDLYGRAVLHANLANLFIVTQSPEAFAECELALHWEDELNAAVSDERAQPPKYGDLVSCGSTCKAWALIEQKRYGAAVEFAEQRVRNRPAMKARLGNSLQRIKAELVLSKGVLASLWSKQDELMQRGELLCRDIHQLVDSFSLVELPWNMACLHARLGFAAEALGELEAAVALGADRAAVARDADLASLRDHPRFLQLVGRVRKKRPPRG